MDHSAYEKEGVSLMERQHEMSHRLGEDRDNNAIAPQDFMPGGYEPGFPHGSELGRIVRSGF
jgi:hypothetical protein